MNPRTRAHMRLAAVATAATAPLALSAAPASATAYTSCAGTAVRHCVTLNYTTTDFSGTSSIRDAAGGTDYDVYVSRAVVQYRPCGGSWTTRSSYPDADGWHLTTDYAPDQGLGGGGSVQARYQYRVYADMAWRKHGTTTASTARYYTPVVGAC